ncbi:hypothetical protein [Spectribacter hydrogenoxidans]|uniref:NifU-like domain-containing protein n=1 Tax=Spectribacter hydrogenoxidans TaxID=3075608 RepID=A0ABU3C428_9GAMM|nr:hypothetical protein [Salinisphaera sp. W335]MDT0636277.1 hypothetical protein [Salinisphaera sp. W335]
MSRGGEDFDGQVARLQGLLAALDGVGEPAAADAARELVQVVIEMHGMALSELMSLIGEAGAQPADTLPPKLAANPRVRGLLLLHDLHPDDLATRAGQALDRLRPHLAVQGVRAELAGVANGAVRVTLTASGQKSNRPSAEVLRREIEETLLDMAPDATDLVIDGLETASGAQEVYVPISAIARAG